MKGARSRRPKQYDELLKLLVDKEGGVFDTLKSALVFSASLGFKKGVRLAFQESGEGVDFSIFNEYQDQPFVYLLALAELDDASYLRDDKFETVKLIFEEYAAGGLQFLDAELDKSNIKESLETILAETQEDDFISDIAGYE